MERIRTTSRLARGHRRAGVRHEMEPTLWPSGQFSDEQLAELEDDPNLVVERVEIDEEEAAEGAGDAPPAAAAEVPADAPPAAGGKGGRGKSRS